MAEWVLVGDMSPPEDIDPPRPPKDDEVVIVFSGKSGAGKSTLIENILQVKTSTPPSPYPITEACIGYPTERNDVPLMVIDTVGLISGENMNKQLQDVATYTNCNVDLLVYCLHVGPGMKIVDGNPAMMKALQEAFSKDVWKHCILIFTFSNLMWESFSRKNDEKEIAVASYRDYIRKYAAAFQQQLETLGENEIEVRTIFDMPYRTNERRTIVAIPAGEEHSDQVLPGVPMDKNDRWMGVIIQEMIESCRESRRAAFAKYREAINWKKVGLVAVLGGAAVGAGVVVAPYVIAAGPYVVAGAAAVAGALTRK